MNEEKCGGCNGFGYTKGGPEGPWEKLDCEDCGGTGDHPDAGVRQGRDELINSAASFPSVEGEPVGSVESSSSPVSS